MFAAGPRLAGCERAALPAIIRNRRAFHSSVHTRPDQGARATWRGQVRNVEKPTQAAQGPLRDRNWIL
jgi:hypothetical protein